MLCYVMLCYVMLCCVINKNIYLFIFLVRFQNIHDDKIFISYNMHDALFFASQKFNTIVLTRDIKQTKNQFLQFQNHIDICQFDLKILDKSEQNICLSSHGRSVKDRKLFNFHLLQKLSSANVCCRKVVIFFLNF